MAVIDVLVFRHLCYWGILISARSCRLVHCPIWWMKGEDSEE